MFRGMDGLLINDVKEKSVYKQFNEGSVGRPACLSNRPAKIQAFALYFIHLLQSNAPSRRQRITQTKSTRNITILQFGFVFLRKKEAPREC